MITLEPTIVLDELLLAQQNYSSSLNNKNETPHQHHKNMKPPMQLCDLHLQCSGSKSDEVTMLEAHSCVLVPQCAVLAAAVKHCAEAGQRWSPATPLILCLEDDELCGTRAASLLQDVMSFLYGRPLIMAEEDEAYVTRLAALLGASQLLELLSIAGTTCARSQDISDGRNVEDENNKNVQEGGKNAEVLKNEKSLNCKISENRKTITEENRVILKEGKRRKDDKHISKEQKKSSATDKVILSLNKINKYKTVHSNRRMTSWASSEVTQNVIKNNPEEETDGNTSKSDRTDTEALKDINRSNDDWASHEIQENDDTSNETELEILKDQKSDGSDQKIQYNLSKGELLDQEYREVIQDDIEVQKASFDIDKVLNTQLGSNTKTDIIDNSGGDHSFSPNLFTDHVIVKSGSSPCIKISLKQQACDKVDLNEYELIDEILANEQHQTPSKDCNDYGLHEDINRNVRSICTIKLEPQDSGAFGIYYHNLMEEKCIEVTEDIIMESVIKQSEKNERCVQMSIKKDKICFIISPVTNEYGINDCLFLGASECFISVEEDSMQMTNCLSSNLQEDVCVTVLDSEEYNSTNEGSNFDYADASNEPKYTTDSIISHKKFKKRSYDTAENSDLVVLKRARYEGSLSSISKMSDTQNVKLTTDTRFMYVISNGKNSLTEGLQTLTDDLNFKVDSVSPKLSNDPTYKIDYRIVDSNIQRKSATPAVALPGGHSVSNTSMNGIDTPEYSGLCSVGSISVVGGPKTSHVLTNWADGSVAFLAETVFDKASPAELTTSAVRASSANVSNSYIGGGVLCGATDSVVVHPVEEGQTSSVSLPSSGSCGSKSSVGRLRCGSCEMYFRKCADLLHHVTTDQHYSVTCPICSFQANELESQKSHFALHDSPLPFFCCGCELRFRTRCKLAMHIPKHSNTKPYPCSECGRSFKWRHAMQAHVLTHRSKGHFLCDICGFSSNYVATFKGHLQQHTGQAFRCPHAGCSFKAFKKVNLKSHIATHSNVRTHQCEVCGNSFSLARNLIRHMVFHSNMRLLCGAVSKLICPFSTTRPDKLRCHLDKKHNMAHDGTPKTTVPIKHLPLAKTAVDGAAKVQFEVKKNVNKVKPGAVLKSTQKSNKDLLIVHNISRIQPEKEKTFSTLLKESITANKKIVKIRFSNTSKRPVAHNEVSNIEQSLNSENMTVKPAEISTTITPNIILMPLSSHIQSNVLEDNDLVDRTIKQTKSMHTKKLRILKKSICKTTGMQKNNGLKLVEKGSNITKQGKETKTVVSSVTTESMQDTPVRPQEFSNDENATVVMELDGKLNNSPKISINDQYMNNVFQPFESNSPPQINLPVMANSTPMTIEPISFILSEDNLPSSTVAVLKSGANPYIISPPLVPHQDSVNTSDKVSLGGLFLQLINTPENMNTVSSARSYSLQEETHFCGQRIDQSQHADMNEVSNLPSNLESLIKTSEAEIINSLNTLQSAHFTITESSSNNLTIENDALQSNILQSDDIDHVFSITNIDIENNLLDEGDNSDRNETQLHTPTGPTPEPPPSPDFLAPVQHTPALQPSSSLSQSVSLLTNLPLLQNLSVLASTSADLSFTGTELNNVTTTTTCAGMTVSGINKFSLSSGSDTNLVNMNTIILSPSDQLQILGLQTENINFLSADSEETVCVIKPLIENFENTCISDSSTSVNRFQPPDQNIYIIQPLMKNVQTQNNIHELQTANENICILEPLMENIGSEDCLTSKPMPPHTLIEQSSAHIGLTEENSTITGLTEKNINYIGVTHQDTNHIKTIHQNSIHGGVTEENQTQAAVTEQNATYTTVAKQDSTRASVVEDDVCLLQPLMQALGTETTLPTTVTTTTTTTTTTSGDDQHCDLSFESIVHNWASMD